MDTGSFLAAGSRCPLFGNFHAWRDSDILPDLLIHGVNIVVAIAVVEGPNYGGVCPSHNAKYSSFGAAIGSDICDLDQYTVSVHRRPHCGRRDENISAKERFQGFGNRSRLGYDKAVSVSMHAQPAD
jgi:hypothetical protein